MKIFWTFIYGLALCLHATVLRADSPNTPNLPQENFSYGCELELHQGQRYASAPGWYSVWAKKTLNLRREDFRTGYTGPEYAIENIGNLNDWSFESNGSSEFSRDFVQGHAIRFALTNHINRASDTVTLKFEIFVRSKMRFLDPETQRSFELQSNPFASGNFSSAEPIKVSSDINITPDDREGMPNHQQRKGVTLKVSCVKARI